MSVEPGRVILCIAVDRLFSHGVSSFLLCHLIYFYIVLEIFLHFVFNVVDKLEIKKRDVNKNENTLRENDHFLPYLIDHYQLQ